MELRNTSFEALMNYFACLEHFGYKSYNEVDKLIVLLCIEEILNGEMSYFMTASDYEELNNALYCLYGTCMIPYPTYLESMSDINKKVDSYRITETGILRESYNLLRRSS